MKHLTPKQYLLNKAKPLFVIAGFIILLNIIATIIFISFHVEIALVGLLGADLLIIVLYAYLIDRILKDYNKEIASSLNAMSNQLSFFSKRYLYLSRKSHLLADIDNLQKDIDSCISSFSHYTLLNNDDYVNKDLENITNNRTIITRKEFEKILPIAIDQNVSFFSGVLIFKLQNKLNEETTKKLLDTIYLHYSKSIVAKYDDYSLITYSPALSSVPFFVEHCLNIVKTMNEFVDLSQPDIYKANSCVIGASIYPYCFIDSLISDAEKAVKRSKSVEVEINKSRMFSSLSLNANNEKVRHFLALMGSVDYQLSMCETQKEQRVVLLRLCKWIMSNFGFTNIGIFLTDGVESGYYLHDEFSLVDSSPLFTKIENNINSGAITHLYNACVNSNGLFAQDATFVPLSILPFLQNLNIKSFYAYRITYTKEKNGIIIASSDKEHRMLSIYEDNCVSYFLSYLALYTKEHKIASNKHELDQVENVLLTRNKQFYYTIERSTYKLIYLSSTIQKAFPNAKPGDICYKAFRHSHDTPCSHCPLSRGTDKRVIDNISCELNEVSCIRYTGNNATILISPVNKATTKTTNMLDNVLPIKNKDAFIQDVSQLMKTGHTGYIISLRLSNSDHNAPILKEGDNNYCLLEIIKRLSAVNDTNIMYRISDNVISFVLDSYQISKVYDFIESVSETISQRIELNNTNFIFEICGSLIPYPTGIDIASETISIIEKELDRAQLLSPYVYVVYKDKERHYCLRKDYVLNKLKQAIDTQKLSSNIQPIYNKNKQIEGGELLARLFDSKRGNIPPLEFIHVASQYNLTSKIDLEMLRDAGRLFESYGYNLFNNVSLKYLSVNFSYHSLKSTDFIDDVTALFKRYHLPKGFIHFEFAYNELGDDLSLLTDENKAKLEQLGVVIVIDRCTNEEPSTDVLQAKKLNYIKLDRNVIQNARLDKQYLANLSRSISNLIKGEINITIEGIETNEQHIISREMGISHLQGYYYSKPLEVDEFISLLNYGSK